MEENFEDEICKNQDFKKILLELKEDDRNKKFYSAFQIIEDNSDIPSEDKRKIYKEVFDYINEINKNFEKNIEKIFRLGVRETLNQINKSKLNFINNKNIENNNLEQTSSEYEKWYKNYHRKEILELKKLFNEDEITILKKLEIEIENKKYTEYEIECFWLKVLEYYKDENEELSEEEESYIKPLDSTVSREEYNLLLKKIEKILRSNTNLC